MWPWFKGKIPILNYRRFLRKIWKLFFYIIIFNESLLEIKKIRKRFTLLFMLHVQFHQTGGWSGGHMVPIQLHFIVKFWEDLTKQWKIGGVAMWVTGFAHCTVGAERAAKWKWNFSSTYLHAAHSSWQQRQQQEQLNSGAKLRKLRMESFRVVGSIFRWLMMRMISSLVALHSTPATRSVGHCQAEIQTSVASRLASL